MDTTTAIARKAASLPRDFYSQNKKSIYDLLKQTGYFDKYSTVGESQLFEAISAESSLVDDWLRYSEDKRGGNGWYFIADGDQYTVGNLTNGKEFCSPDRFRMAAHFAKHELEEIRES